MIYPLIFIQPRENDLWIMTCDEVSSKPYPADPILFDPTSMNSCMAGCVITLLFWSWLPTLSPDTEGWRELPTRCSQDEDLLKYEYRSRVVNEMDDNG